MKIYNIEQKIVERDERWECLSAQFCGQPVTLNKDLCANAPVIRSCCLSVPAPSPTAG